jgi:hypothetical protein
VDVSILYRSECDDASDKNVTGTGDFFLPLNYPKGKVHTGEGLVVGLRF